MSTAQSTHFIVPTLGEPLIKSPIKLASESQFNQDSERILKNPSLSTVDLARTSIDTPESFEIAGPRAKLFFEPKSVRAAVVTCGGICPGINSVVRTIVIQLRERYGCEQVFGIRNGYQGFSQDPKKSLIELTSNLVADCHLRGGTILGTSRGSPATRRIVDRLHEYGIDVLFTIGGDGTMRGARAIFDEASKRNMKLAVIGVPKTIDNDIPFVRRTFGFETAMGIAVEAIRTADVEARSFENGIGLVRLMGRESGFIAASATLASGNVDCCLIPEINFGKKGLLGLLDLLQSKLNEKSRAVIVVAEGVGQEFFENERKTQDPSGNRKLGNIGLFLKDRIEEFFQKRNISLNMKYIDPSYMIRGCPPNPADQLFCSRLAQNAVHAAMAGKTGILIGYWHGRMTHVPLKLLADERQKINPAGELWHNVLESTGQPPSLG